MHSYCHRQRTCHGLPLSKKTKTKQKPLALSTTAVRSFVTNPNEQHIQTFLWTDYSPSHANTRTGSICALCFKQLQTLFCTWKSPSKTDTHIKKKAPVVPLRCHSGCVRTALCRRQTDRCCGQSTSQDWRTRPAIRICAHQRKDPGSQCSARLLNHRNYFQRQPEHVEDKFMHHNRKKMKSDPFN